MPTPSVPLNNVQERVERSLFEAIREVLVDHGYLPEAAAYSNDQVGNDLFLAAKKAIVTTIAPGKTNVADAIDIFGSGSELSKGIEACPRIVCVTRRIMPGDIGKDIQGEYDVNPSDPDKVNRRISSYQSCNIHIDIEIVSKTARQDRIIHAILAEAIGGTMGFIKLYDTTINEKFFIRQFNFYDLPDTENGIIKKVYSYEIPDMYLSDGMIQTNYPLIEQITVDIFTVPHNAIITADGTVPDPNSFNTTDVIFVDLSGINFND